MWGVFQAFLDILKTAPLETKIFISPYTISMMFPNGNVVYSPNYEYASGIEMGLFLGMVAAIANERQLEIT